MEKCYQAIKFTKNGVQYASPVFKSLKEVKEWIDNDNKYKNMDLDHIEIRSLSFYEDGYLNIRTIKRYYE